ncbi:MAG: hypothetical protein JWM53_2785 [bacterium]|nr:hypothetical protein [bacterium]
MQWMSTARHSVLVAVLPALVGCHHEDARPCASWMQWAQGGAHGGGVCTGGQTPKSIITSMTVDPNERAEAVAGNGLQVHYQVPLTDGDDVYVLAKTGQWNMPCPPSPPDMAVHPCYGWDTQVWTETRYHWGGINADSLDKQWTVASDWQPVPGDLTGDEPMFQPVIVGDVLYLPAAGGSLLEIDRKNGAQLARNNPFGTTIDPNLYVAGPLTADSDGNVLYNALELDHEDPTGVDAKGWLVRVSPSNETAMIEYGLMVPNAPTGNQCHGSFATMMPSPAMPWPPPPNPDGSPVTPPPIACGSQRPGVNVAPAVGPDGTIFTVSRAHFSDRDGFIVALAPDLSPKWAVGLGGILSDGCGVNVDFDGDAVNHRCRAGSATGVDPATNQPPIGRVVDDSSSSPVALPDGGVLYGSYSLYNNGRGHLFKLAADGTPAGTFDFGWDYTPAVWQHGDNYSIVVKDNHYNPDYGDTGARDPGPFFVTQLSAAMTIEWQFQNTNSQYCYYQLDSTGPGPGVITTTPPAGLEPTCQHTSVPGFEWCVNAPALDADGTVFVNGEDGDLYAIGQGGVDRGHLFLRQAVGSSYTPVAIDSQGRLYSQNAGQLLVVGH